MYLCLYICIILGQIHCLYHVGIAADAATFIAIAIARRWLHFNGGALSTRDARTLQISKGLQRGDVSEMQREFPAGGIYEIPRYIHETN